MAFAYAHDACFDAHRAPPGHPEREARLAAALSGLRAGGVPTEQAPIATRPATPDELSRVHHAGYLQRLDEALASDGGELDGDTYFSAGTRHAALCAAGVSIDLAREVLSGRAQRGFALVRPPGHHAEPDRAMGFCMLDNIAVAARAALTEGVGKLAIIDWDVHHGNGTQAAFYDDPNVLFISTHQSPLYPGTGHPGEVGEGRARGTTINLALPAGSGDAELWAAFDQVVCPALDAFRPELFLVSAGFDAHAADPLAGLELSAQGFAGLAGRVRELAELHAEGKIMAVLEGGYDLAALTASVAAVTDAWLQPERPSHVAVDVAIRPLAQRAIDATRQALSGNRG